MTFYLLRRVAQALLVIVIVSVLTFVESRLIPGDPAHAILGLHASPEQLAAFRREQGYDDALPLQYLNYVNQLLHGDLGTSQLSGASVAAELV